jgi:hypothetical protein
MKNIHTKNAGGTKNKNGATLLFVQAGYHRVKNFVFPAPWWIAERSEDDENE